jgi:hypothetical protein
VSTVVLERETRWACPNCPLTDLTREARPHSRMHQCAGLRGILAPMIEAGTRCKVEAVERGDYVGSEKGLRYDGEGRPIMAVRTVRDDGVDCAVFPATATGSMKEIR